MAERTFSDLEREVLTVTLARVRAVEKAPRPKFSWDLREWQEERDNGPRYCTTDVRWFGKPDQQMPEYLRQRYLRQVRKLGAEGYLVLVMSAGKTLCHVGLTALGRKAAEGLEPAREKPVKKPVPRKDQERVKA